MTTFNPDHMAKKLHDRIVLDTACPVSLNECYRTVMAVYLPGRSETELMERAVDKFYGRKPKTPSDQTEQGRVKDAYWAERVKYQEAITLLTTRHSMTPVEADNFLHPIEG